MTDRRPAWIFFDCFNTLLDDFDETGDESGLSPIVHLPVRDGYFATLRATSQMRIRAGGENRLSGNDSREGRA